MCHFPFPRLFPSAVYLIVTLSQFPEYAQSIKTTNSANPRTLNCTGGDVGWRAALRAMPAHRVGDTGQLDRDLVVLLFAVAQDSRAIRQCP